MNKTKLKPIALAVMLCAGTAFGLSSCDTGTSPGDVNTERSDIHEEGSMVSPDKENEAEAERDSMEQHYDHADHENHDNNKAGAVHAGDGKQDDKNQ